MVEPPHAWRRLEKPGRGRLGTGARTVNGFEPEVSRAGTAAPSRDELASEAENEFAESEEEPESTTAFERADDDEDREIQALILEGDAADIEEITAQPEAPLDRERSRAGIALHAPGIATDARAPSTRASPESRRPPPRRSGIEPRTELRPAPVWNANAAPCPRSRTF